tara:strand:+ start:1528 stop:2829 length:1302 start_codon:yes stop_codon:yes gene_type:complete
MSAAGASNYSFFQIAKPNRGIVVRAEGKIVGLNYYESVYSPMVTANVVFEDVGGSVPNEQTGLRGTIKDALPIEGFEEVSFIVATASGELNFKRNPMIVTGSPMNIDSPQKQTIFIPMVSEFAIKNANKPLDRIYPEAPISDTVQKILSDPTILNIPKDKQFIEKTSNNDKVSGNHETALDVILQQCRKSIPVDGKDPGYFFFETKSGFKYQSINGLINKGIENFSNNNYRENHTYNYSSALEANLDNNLNDFKVLMPPVVRRDQDQLSSLRNGQYNVRICTMNTLTHEYTEKVENLLSSSNLGEKEVTPVDSKKFSKSYTYVINPGADEKGVSEEVINSPANYEPKAHMRYGLLHAQLVDIQIPCNVNLEAGDVIKLELENITQDDKLLQIYNQHRSGYYLILHLCHHFDTDNSFTSLTLARDTYGLYTSKK